MFFWATVIANASVRRNIEVIVIYSVKSIIQYRLRRDGKIVSVW